MSGKLVHLTEKEFSVKVGQSKGLVLVDFWAPWCGPCVMVGPILEQLAEELSGKVTIFKLNVDDHGSLAQRFAVSGIPTMLLFKDGELSDTYIGAAPKQRIREFIEKHMA